MAKSNDKLKFIGHFRGGKKMKNQISHSRLDVLGNGHGPTDQEIFNSVLRRWRHRLGYGSVFVAVPAVLASQLNVTRSAEIKEPQARVTTQGARLLEKLTLNSSKRSLLKRQSAFRLPHQESGSDILTPLGGADECPGRVIPGGTYTTALPFVDSGDTTGSNNTVSNLESQYYYYYGNYPAQGPDLVYSFTITSLGPNPQIEVSGTSGSYQPLIYVLVAGSGGVCPASTGNLASNWATIRDSRWTKGRTATVERNQMNGLPLNIPLHLFIDSAENDASGSGPYTVRMQDVTIAPTPSPNQIDETQFFVRQHYRDFLNRDADPEGLAFWMNEINSCGADQKCIEVKRINDSGSFFLSIEFQETGYLVYRFYKTSYGNLPGTPVPIRLSEFLPDTQEIAENVIVKQSGWEQKIESNKLAFATEFVQRARFVSTYPTSMSSEQFVDALFANSEVTPSASDRNAAISEFSFHATTNDVAARARVLRRVAEHPMMVRQEFPRAFVLMQYFGYLRRNPNDAPDGNFDGHNFWLDKLNSFNGDFIQAEMVKAFISSTEYRRRFGS
jgi:hypothetical protein